MFGKYKLLTGVKLADCENTNVVIDIFIIIFKMFTLYVKTIFPAQTPFPPRPCTRILHLTQYNWPRSANFINNMK